MTETRKLATILVADVVGYSRLAAADEDRTLARLRGLRSDLIDPAIAAHRGAHRQGARATAASSSSAAWSMRCAAPARCRTEWSSAMPVCRPSAGSSSASVSTSATWFEEDDGDLMGYGVNVAARLEAICEPGGICLSDDAYRQVRDKVEVSFADLREKALRNIARPVRVFALRAHLVTRQVYKQRRSAEWRALAA